MEISRLENLSGDIGITGTEMIFKLDFSCACALQVIEAWKKKRMYQQETTILQRVIQCELFYNQGAVILREF